MIDPKKIEEKKETQKRIEKIENRIMINYGIAVLAYLVLYVLYNTFYMKYQLVLPLAGIMLIAAVVCYILHRKTKKTKNYGHMFIGFTVALLITNSSTIISKLFGENVFNSLYGVNIVAKLLNSRNEVIGIALLGAVYLVGMTIYNSVLISKEKNKRKNKKSGKK